MHSFYHPDTVNAKLTDIMDKFLSGNLLYAVQYNEIPHFKTRWSFDVGKAHLLHRSKLLKI